MDGRFWMTLLAGFVGDFGIYTARRAKLMFLFLCVLVLSCFDLVYVLCSFISHFCLLTISFPLYQGLFFRKFMVCNGSEIAALGDSKRLDCNH